jgi:hypothetical protein
VSSTETTKKTFLANDAYYLASGHSIIVAAGTELIEFSSVQSA